MNPCLKCSEYDALKRCTKGTTCRHKIKYVLSDEYLIDKKENARRLKNDTIAVDKRRRNLRNVGFFS